MGSDPIESADAPLDVTLLLSAIQAGNQRAWEPLLARVHAELHQLAHASLSNEHAWHALQTTALVNETYLKLVADSSERFENRAHFFSAAARAMRRILVDEARRRKALKRGGGRMPLSISQVLEAAQLVDEPRDEIEQVELVHRALENFEGKSSQRDKARLVELRFFVGLTNEQSAEVLGVSLATVKRDWDFARAWLRREMERLARVG